MLLGTHFRRANTIRLQRRYLVYSSGSRFYSFVDPKRGWKGQMSRLLFQLQIPTRRGREEKTILEREFHDVVSEFLLYDTHDYKTTSWIGVVALETRPPVFVKIYKRREDAAQNFLRSQKAGDIFTPYFALAESFYFDGLICAYSLLNKRRNVDIADVEERVLKRYAAEFSKREWAVRTSDWLSEDDMKLLQRWDVRFPLEMFKRAGREQMWSHGDLSHWNCFLDSAGRLCLIDYEEVGLYPPLYDWFHLTLKPS
ncbi:MAG: phosphotransferase, partial [Myxococcota bacterium]|nr:phosphotransferase [Myxococcota bacterium]